METVLVILLNTGPGRLLNFRVARGGVKMDMRLLERNVYFTLTVTTSTKQIRRVVCSRSKIENRVCE